MRHDAIILSVEIFKSILDLLLAASDEEGRRDGGKRFILTFLLSLIV